jgi:hypothetical protein
MKIAAVVILAILGVVALVSAGWAIRYYTAPVRGTIEAYEQIQSGDTRIVAYNYFFNLYASIQAYDPAIQAQEELLATTTDADEKARIGANIAGLKSQKARSIAQYNADAMKSYTIGQFRDWKLPYQITDNVTK